MGEKARNFSTHIDTPPVKQNVPKKKIHACLRARKGARFLSYPLH